MFPKVTRKKPTCTTRHITVLSRPSNVPGERFTPFFQLVNVHFLLQGTPEPLSLCWPPLGSPAHIEPAQSHATRGTGELKATREGTGEMCCSVSKEFVHSRSIASLPMPLGRTPLFQKAMTLTVDMSITHTHTHNSRAPGHPAACKTTRWGLNKTFPHCSKGIMYLRPEWHKTHPRGDILQGFMEAVCVCESGQGVTSH